MSRITHHASRIMPSVFLMGFGCFFPLMHVQAQPVTASGTCVFSCATAARVTSPPTDTSLSSLSCSADAECIARCDTSCSRPAGVTCAMAPFFTGNAAPHCVVAPTPPTPPTRTPGEFHYNNPLGNVSLNQLLGRVVRTTLGFVGALFLAMFVYGGTTWMLAGGDSEKVKSSQKILLNSVIGLIVIGISYSVISIVFETASLIKQ